MNWKSYSLAELGYVSRGRSRHRPRDAAHLYGGPYPFVQTGDIKHADLYVTSYSQTYSEAGLAQSKLWPKGTLCITIAANIADTAILGFEACFPDSVIGFLADLDKCDAKFIKYKFDILKHQYQQFSQGAAQDNLSQEKLLSVKFLVPNLSTQRRIAGILSAYDDLIENNRRRIQLLEQTARLIYQEWFVRLRFPGYEHVRIVDGVPEGWERTVVANLGEIVTGKTPSTREPANFGGTIPFIKTPDMHRNTFVIDTESFLSQRGANTQRNKTVPENTILVSCIGTIGVVSITSQSSQFNQQINGLIPRQPELTFYTYFALENLKAAMEAIGGGATMGNVNKTKFESLAVLLPEFKLLKDFHLLVNPLFRQIRILQQCNTKLRSARDLLLPKLMSGEIEV